jgi:hypothetical protein
MGCYWSQSILITLLISTLAIPFGGVYGFYLVALIFLLIFLSVVYFWNFASLRVKKFEKELIQKDQKALNLTDVKALALFKKISPCKRFPKVAPYKELSVTIIYIGEKFLTISTKCPKFHLFKKDRHGSDKRWAIKDKCGMNKELYYSYIQSVYFDANEKLLKIVLTSGDIESISCEKKYAQKAVDAIREKLRTTDRSIQTNPIKA